LEERSLNKIQNGRNAICLGGMLGSTILVHQPHDFPFLFIAVHFPIPSQHVNPGSNLADSHLHFRSTHNSMMSTHEANEESATTWRLRCPHVIWVARIIFSHGPGHCPGQVPTSQFRFRYRTSGGGRFLSFLPTTAMHVSLRRRGRG